MSLNALFNTGLTFDDLEPDADDGQVNRAHSTHVIRFGPWSMPVRPVHEIEFGNSSGMNESGVLSVGGVYHFPDFPRAVGISTFQQGREQTDSRRDDPTVSSISATLLFELERLFKKPANLVLDTILQDSGRREDASHPEVISLKTITDQFREAYAQKLASSPTGKPILEMDYAARRQDHHSTQFMDAMYGKRLHGLLRAALKNR
jgi:hypothetical protein